ncbi:DUF6517 family protein [Haloplanus aerogenes]|uniref:Uncharacterized protein n=1 Tax=Haloplanus aerogenes TaxID=660522 RepID=A0A3M0DB52_9EURY|nr:DUF6517 family protein [Haloplanus aerogenes]AZH23970.1 hypothetical protein DU502_00635 [Haloplanus aerogenes]RMB13263.1 hypothetical protein ATH50_2596 [Haloplanus aerogenes]
MPRLAVTLGVLVLVLAAGCAGGGDGTPTDDPPLRATATPATLDPATLDATGYTERHADTPPLNTTITARIEGDVTLQTTRDVRATTARRVYGRATPDGSVVVGLYAVPAVQPFENADLRKNPATGLSTADVLTRAQTVYDVRDLSQTGQRSVTLLGTDATLTQYEGMATANGTDRPVTAAVVTVAHGDDYVTAAVVTPRGRDAPLVRLVEAVRHEKTESPRRD